MDLSGVTNVSEHFPVCVARCQLEEDDQCQFVILDGSDCIFGSFDSGITPLPSPPSSPQRAYVVPGNTLNKRDIAFAGYLLVQRCKHVVLKSDIWFIARG